MAGLNVDCRAEGCAQGNDEIRRFYKRFGDCDTDDLAGSHLMGDAGQPRDIARDRARRLLKTARDTGHIADLDDLV